MRLGPVDISRRRANGNGSIATTTSLAEALQGKYVVDVTEDAILAVEKEQGTQLSSRIDYGEIGTSGVTSWGQYLREEYKSELRGYLGLKMYDKMRRSDAKVRSTLRLIKTPVLGANWYVDPASLSPMDKMIAEQISNNLFNTMTISWSQFLKECLLHLDFGFYSFEKVLRIKDGLVEWQKFAPRHSMDLWEWEYDANGGPNAGVFYAPNTSPESRRIPIEKLLVFTYDQEAGDLCGIPLLRSVYKHWYFKENLYKIDAIQKERHGIGIPVVTLPPGYKEEDKNAANELGRNLRTNENAHVVLPPNWELVFAKLEGQPVDCMVSIEHHNRQIADNILAGFLENKTATNQEDAQTLFLRATRFVADGVRDVINKWAIPEIVAYNWGSDVQPPELKVRNIGYAVDWRVLSFALRNLVGAGIIIPDEELETRIREEIDMPKADKSTSRQVASPQLPNVGPPSQSTAAGSQQGKNPGSSNVGVDQSGG